MPALLLPAPAKLNLMLHITGQRADGYHELQTLFQLLDRGDDLEFSPTLDGRIELSPPLPDVADDDNLIIKAARLLKPYASANAGVAIQLHKRLPMGGGLGGGSSDAATALVALNHLWQCRLSEDQLAELGLSLGADVPVFVRGRSAWAEGVGERLTPVELPEHWFVVLQPGVSVNTARLFADTELTRNTPVSTIRSALAGAGHNDFEAVARKRYPEIELAFTRLAEFGQVRLSGSGASLFLTTQSDMAAQDLLRSILEQYPGYSGFTARGVNQSPLQRSLANTA
ncbi:4-(cytidine 5'-diphospho)-2-C-methyl-D-erythritol kinase [Saccharospirillum mangrovi]|uniref:4-(cytidine 5'-diphospho)-2-C-methyl-D-erythritol kinase n=1 Tax=Saccharospirillum mangrovi TaxID=2161747 RepID=UPI000D3BD6F1|nr:4-(cytidine 5'-diphospho)-2-C-methyl-D-erythritol kinase [Saccharospirillum mangrovi]